MSYNLLDYRKNKYSEVGQDGIIEHIFNVLGIKKGHFVEFGAWDGVYSSNCRKLFEEGWSGVFIECDKKKFSDLQKNYESTERVICINKRVEINGLNKFDKIISRYTSGGPITLLTIDVDGVDLEIFESIEEYLPTVVSLEGGKGVHPLDPRMPIHCIHDIGQSLKVIKDVAESKEYKILCSFQDTFLIKQDLFAHFNVPVDLFQLYINGYLAQDYTRIPMYMMRLRRLHRKNRMLDYILAETNYNKYRTDKEWAEECELAISSILMSLPDYICNAKINRYERVLISLKCLPRILRMILAPKKYSDNHFWRFAFYIYKIFFRR